MLICRIYYGTKGSRSSVEGFINSKTRKRLGGGTALLHSSGVSTRTPSKGCAQHITLSTTGFSFDC